MVGAELKAMEEIRCCLSSEQCDLSKRKQERVDCSEYIAETSDERALLGAELFVVRGVSSIAPSLPAEVRGHGERW